MESNDNHLVFLSYAPEVYEDAEKALKLYDDLIKARISVWFDKKNLLPGVNRDIAIKKAIRNCRYFLSLTSSYSISNEGHFHKELNIALKERENFPINEIFIIPVRLDDCGIDSRLEGIHPVDLSSSWNKGIEQILIAVQLSASKDEKITLLKQMLVPPSLGMEKEEQFVVAASPISFRERLRIQHNGMFRYRRIGHIATYSDHLGIRGLMQSFGLIFGLQRLPHLIDPDDFDDQILEISDMPMNIYAIGSSKANRWTDILMDKFFSDNQGPKWKFKPDPESEGIMNPRVMVCRNNDTPYRPIDVSDDDKDRLKWDFGLVIRGANPLNTDCLLMILAGRGFLGTEASCLAVTDPQCLKKFRDGLKHKEIDLDNHKQAFCAIVSVKASNLIAKKDTFRFHDVVKY